MGIKICLDAGHFAKYNRSPVVPEYYESDMVWKLHLLLKAELEKYGIEVITTRANKDKDMGLEARGKASKGCDLFLSIHSNGADRESADYPVVYYPISGACSDLALNITKFVAQTMNTVEKGTAWSKKSDKGNWDYYSVIYGATKVGVPGLIIEHSFHTNTKSAKWLLDDSNLAKLAVGEAEVIASYYGLQKPVEKPKEEPKEEPEHWYRIRKSWEDAKSQIAAYKSKDGAIYACPVGYSVFDWNGNVVYTKDAPTPQPTTYTLTLPVLRKGDKGSHVEALQNLLLANKIKLPRYGADSDFGGETEAGVIAFQKAVGIDADGVVGHDTMSKLLGMK